MMAIEIFLKDSNGPTSPTDMVSHWPPDGTTQTDANPHAIAPLFHFAALQFPK